MDKGKDEKLDTPGNKNKKKEEQVKSDKEFPFKVKICDIWGSQSKDTIIIPVKRWIEGPNTYLYNEKFGFKEYEPKDSDEYKQYKIDELKEKISTEEKKLKNKNDNTNEKDIRANIKRYENYKRSLELQGRGSYMRLDLEGKPYFEFDRVGNFRMPVFKNIDKSLLYTPEESKIKLGSELLRENEEKNGDPNKPIKFLNLLITVALILILALFTYTTWKTTELPDICSENLDKASIVYVNSANQLERIAGNIENISSKMYLRPDDVKQEIKGEVVN